MVGVCVCLCVCVRVFHRILALWKPEPPGANAMCVLTDRARRTQLDRVLNRALNLSCDLERVLIALEYFC